MSPKRQGKSKGWLEFVWHLYEHLPPVADDILKWRFRYTYPFKNLSVPVAILRGATRFDGQRGTLVVAGAEHSIDYMIRRFFAGEYQREIVDTVPLWSLAGTLKHLRTSADLTIVRIDRLSARLLFDPDYLGVPEWVGSLLAVPEDLTKLVKSSRNLKEDLRIVRRNKLSSEVTHAQEDFEVFYKTMHVPFILKRHGEQAIIRNFHKLRRAFRQGALLWVLRGGRRISGVVFQQRGHLLYSLGVGTANGEWIHGKTGAIIATYFFMIERAKQLDCKFIDFGGSRPSLNDGVLRYKRKWGIHLADKHDVYYDFLVYWNRFAEPVISFLANTSLIFRDQGRLSALYIVNQNEPVTQNQVSKIHDSMWIPGLHRLFLVSTSGCQLGTSSPPQTHVIDLKTARDLTTSKLNEKSDCN